MNQELIPGPRAKELIERDHAVVSPSYTRPYPFVMDHGKGSEVWDVDGNRYIDLSAGLVVCSTGYSHPQVVAAIKDQAERFLHISSDFYHRSWIELSERLASIAPFKGPARVFLANSGAEAVEAAVKLARFKSGRGQFVAFFGAFHGRTMGALAFTASKNRYRSGFDPVMQSVTHVPYPDPLHKTLLPTSEDYGETVVNYIENTVFAHKIPPDDCAAIVVEPIQGEGGYVVPPDGFLPALRRLCDKHGIFLITDEVQSGLGRTGKWWAVEHWGVEPDIITMAKGLASGVPIGAVIARKEIMDWPPGAHANTFGGNPLACRAALATIDLIEKEMMQNAAEVGEYTLDALSEIQARQPCIGSVRGKGLMIGVELVKDSDSFEPAEKLRDRAVDVAFQSGLITLGCGKSTIRVAPPLNITTDVIDEGLGILEASLAQAAREVNG